MFNDKHIEYSYDSFDRKTGAIIKQGSGDPVIMASYSYTAGATTQNTTTLVSGYSYTPNTDAPVSYNYSYDNVGNIISVKKRNNTAIASYQYDSCDQLIRENNAETGYTYLYEYDLGGNITLKKVYSYTTATTPGSLLYKERYTYGDAAHKDRLTKYEKISSSDSVLISKNISYNAYGLPTSSVGTSGYSFTDGGRLFEYTTNTEYINCYYNANPFRYRSYYYDDDSGRAEGLMEDIQYMSKFMTNTILIIIH